MNCMPTQDNPLNAHKKEIFFCLLGLGFIGAALYFFKSPPRSSEVKVINEQEVTIQKEIIAEIAGSVVTPGVYKVENGARVDDLIKKAGGFSENVDIQRVEKTINRASVIKDGQKFYIPSMAEQSVVLSATDQEGGSGDQKISEDTQQFSININTSSQSQLESLWGIGPKTAQKIIEQRPYSEISELLSKSIIKKNVYDRIKDQISVY